MINDKLLLPNFDESHTTIVRRADSDIARFTLASC